MPEPALNLIDALDAADMLPGVDSIRLIRRDVLRGRMTMGRDEARYLVDAYYLVQDHRIRTAAQMRAMEQEDAPAEFLGWLFDHHKRVEKLIGSVLGIYAEGRPSGAWALSQYGIGPVLAAGLEAHIDITRAPSAGHITRFAGLDPSIKWLGREGAKKVMREIEEGIALRSIALTTVDGSPAPPVTDDEDDDGQPAPAWELTAAEVEQLIEILPDDPDEGVTYAMLALASRLTNRKVGNLARLARDEKGRVTKASLLKTLARRPYNSRLKALSWKIGHSFMLFSNRADCFYGIQYRERKAYEQDMNARGMYAAQAAEHLASGRFNGESMARAAYLDGKLPDGQIDARARRWAVKLFLSHWWEVAYEAHYKKPAPEPYPIAHLGHVHRIARPA